MPRRSLIALVAVLVLGAAAATAGAWGGAPGWDNWNCNLKVYWGALGGSPADTGDYFGVQPAATDGYDLIDSKKPGEPLGDYVYAWFEHPTWAQGPIMADWRAPLAEGTSKLWGIRPPLPVIPPSDYWAVKTNKDGPGAGCLDPCFAYFTYPEAASVYIEWAFGVSETPPAPTPPDDYTFTMEYVGGLNAKPAGCAEAGVTVPANGTTWDMEATAYIVLPIWSVNDTIYAYPICDGSVAAADRAKFFFEVNNPDLPVSCTIDVDPPSPQEAPATYAFTANATGDEPLTYDWTFGDGGNASGNPVNHTYASAGSYTATCTVTDRNGDQGECTVVVEVTTPNVPPECSITYSPASPTTADTVTFNANATDTDGTVVGWDWDFGDGNTGTGDPASHQYAIAGTYTVTCTVTDDDGATGTCSTQVTVEEACPTPPCCIEGPTTVTVCEPATWVECSGDPSIVSREWYVDVGCDAVGQELHINPGFEAGWHVVNQPCGTEVGDIGDGWMAWQDGCWGAQYIYLDSAPEVCEGEHAQAVEYVSGSEGFYNLVEGLTPGKTYLVSGCIRIDSGATWWAEFGVSDGNPPAPGQGCTSPDDPYPADPWLWKSDGWGLGPPAYAWYNVGPYRVIPQGTSLIVWYKFGNSGSSSMGYGDAVSVVAGPDATGESLTVHFQNAEDAGPHLVTLVVTNDCGNTACCSQAIEVVLPPCDCTGMTADPTNPNVGDPVTFTVETLGCLEPLTYDWDFDCDGSVDATTGVPTATHSYASHGLKTACVKVTDGGGTWCESFFDVFVNALPICEITGPSTGVALEEECFSGAGSSDPDGGALSYAWDFGDAPPAIPLVNPSFEDSSGWTVHHGGGPPNSFGFCGYAGRTGVSWFGNATSWGGLSAGIYQQVNGLIVGKNYEAEVWINSASWHNDGTNHPENVHTRVGVDPLGGTDPGAASVLWSPDTSNDICGAGPYEKRSVVMAATQTDVTVFCEYWNDYTLEWSLVALDDVALVGSPGTSTEAEPCYTYTDPGTYTITLCVTDDEGTTTCCTHVKEVAPAPNNPPVCDFSYSPANPTDLDNVQFTDLSTDPDAGCGDYIASWAWDFGDGGTDTVQNPTHQYADDGTYTVTLTVTDAAGCGGGAQPQSSTCTRQITVSNVGPECCIDGPTSGQATVELCWTSCSTDPDGTIVSYEWTFGEPGPNLKPEGGFELGFYAVADSPCPGDSGLVGAGWIPWVDGDCGWMNPYLFFDSMAEVCEGEHAQGVEYNNGSKGVCNILPVDPGMTYLVSGCIRIDSPGCYWAEFGVADGTAGPPECGFGCTSPDDPYPGEVWLFKQDGWGMGPVPGAWYTCGPYRVTAAGPQLAIWYKFGNGCGTPSTGYADGVTVTLLTDPVTTPTACHTYSSEGTYEVCLTVTDDDGASATCCQTVVISQNHEPDCCFTYAPATPDDQNPVQFTDCSSDPDGNNLTYSWDLGDGSNSTDQNPSHQYAAGTYEVCLTVTDDGTPPLSATCCQTITVAHINLPPECTITGGPATLTRGEEGCFTASASDPEGGTLTYSWNLDGGTQSYGWADMYEGDVTPNNAGWDRYEGNVNGTSDGNIWHLVDDGGNKTKFAKYPDMSGGVTVVTRVHYIAASNNTNLYAPAYIEASQGRVRCYWDPGGQNVYVRDVTSGGGNYGSVPASTWHILRLSLDSGNNWKLYLDENPAPIGSGVGGSASGPRLTMIGANSTGNTGEVECDYFYWALGAWAPGQAGGPALPGAPQGAEICAKWDTLGVKNVCLTVTDEGGLTATCCTTVEIVNIPPTCSITADPALSVVGRDTTFDANPSDADGTIAAVDWDFGDGGTASGNPATHAFAAAGTYTVTATVTDNDGGTGTCTLAVDANDPPVCVIDGPSVGLTCQELCFSAAESYDPDGGALSYSWHMGDAPPDVPLVNPGFEDGTTGWNPVMNIRNNGDFGVPSRSGGKMCGYESSWGGVTGAAVQEVSGLEAGEEYMLCAWTYQLMKAGCTDQWGRVAVDNDCDGVYDVFGAEVNADAVWPAPGEYKPTCVVFTATGSCARIMLENWSIPGGCEWRFGFWDDVTLAGAATTGTGESQCVTYKECGEYTVTLTVTDDEGISTTCTTTVTIQDGCPPEILECPPDRNVQADESGMAPAPDLCPEVVATDDCDDDLSCSQSPAAGTMLPYGPNTITLTVCDDAGNCAQCQTTVTVGDGTPPVITCPDPGPYCVGEDCTAPCPAATATDNVDPNPVVTQTPAAGDPLAPGHYDIAVTACDQDGNCSTAVCPIDVVDCDPPVITCPPDKVVCNDPGACSAVVDLAPCDWVPVALTNPSFEDGKTGWADYGKAYEHVCGEFWACGITTLWGDCFLARATCEGGPLRGGVYQVVGGLTSDTMRVTAHTVSTMAGGADPLQQWSRVGVDPTGGTDPNAGTVVWGDQLINGPCNFDPGITVTVTAATAGPSATVFVECNDPDWACIGVQAADNVVVEELVCSGGATATDNCEVVSLTNDSPGTFPVGTTTVTWTACDAAGNCSSCEQLVTVNDCEPPTIACSDDITVCNDAGQCSAVVTYPDCVATDNCPGATCSCDPPSGSTFPVGTTTVTCTATDAAGNSAECTFTVTVNDCEPPAITCPADVELCTDPGACEAAACSIEPVALVNPGFEDGDAGWALSGMSIWNHGDWGMPANSGNKMAGCVSSWGGIVGNAVQEVGGLEAGASYTACAYILALSANYYNQTLCNPADQSASVAVDVDCDGAADVSSSINPSYPPAYYQVCVSFTAAGPCARIILDSWSIPGGCEWRFNMFDDVTLEKEACVLGSATATDNCGVVSITNDAPAAFPVGSTTVTWTACDAAGNCSSCTQTVTVVDCEPPTITCPDDITTCNDPGVCEAVVDLGSASASDNCGVTSLTNDAPAVFPVGTTTVTWTACDAAGNCVSCTQTVTVNDCEPPTIVCPDDITTCNDAGECSAVVDIGTATASDNCAVTSLTNDGLAVYPVGTTVVTWTACDAAGNCSSCEQTVTVNDCEPPSITCPDDVTAISPDCEPIQVEIGTAEASDNCGVASLSSDAPALFAPGVTTVVWTACDDAGNCSSCEQTVTVLCPPTCDITYTPASPTTDDVITFDSGASDPDGTIVSVDWDFGDGATATGDPAPHQYAMPGCYTVTVTVCDNDDLCATCTVEVCVDKGTNIPPECDITWTPPLPTPGATVTFNANAYDPNPWGEIVSYEWDFGDGGTASGDPATHAFADTGVYTVCVTITDDQGGQTTCCAQVEVTILCYCDIAVGRWSCRMPAGKVGQTKTGQVAARNMSTTESCDVVLRLVDNAGNVVFETTQTVGPGRKVRVRFSHTYTTDEVGKNLWTWSAWPAECNETTPWNNEYSRRVNVHP